MDLKHDSVRELQTLQKDRDYYLQRMFWDRLAELEYQQKVLHGVIDRNHDNPDVTIKAVHELREYILCISYIHHIFTEIFWLYGLFSIIIIEIYQCSI
jgi:hypothetical protein